jgi:hypothetical protein
MLLDVRKEGAADEATVEEASDPEDETVPPHAAKIIAKLASKVPLLNCMFIDIPPNEFIQPQYKGELR